MQDAPLFNHPVRTPPDVGRSLAWATYLGISWTWCIGMFLPILLVRDFGLLAWFVFAIPNIVGAAAMGWIIRSRDHSLQFVVRHRLATQAFSVVTICFHVFFTIWLVPQLVGNLVAAVAFGLLLVVMIPLFITTLEQTALAIVTLVGSILLAAAVAGVDALSLPALLPANAAAVPAFDLLALSAVCVLGFLTCPYLDLTFHRARQACTPAEARLAFGLGFGLVFASMIVLTLLYTVSSLGNISRHLGILLGTHLVIQSLFTVGVHASALRASVDTIVGHRTLTRWWSACVVGSVLLGLVARYLESKQIGYGAMAAGEFIYRSFLSAYGLIFPAYVWLCVYASRGFLPASRREWQMFAVSVVVAAPFFFIAFMHPGQMRWVLAGVAIVIGARFLVDSTRRDFLAEHRSEMKPPAKSA
jgi:hypothetical protein